MTNRKNDVKIEKAATLSENIFIIKRIHANVKYAWNLKAKYQIAQSKSVVGFVQPFYALS